MTGVVAGNSPEKSVIPAADTPAATEQRENWTSDEMTRHNSLLA
jgi:hypothetical protein